VLKHLRETKSFLGIYDSLQKFSLAGLSEAQVIELIIQHHRERQTCGIVISQMTKGGEVRASSDAAHDCDAILVLGYARDDDDEAPGGHDEGIRVLVVDGKSRLGADDLKTFWKMHGKDSASPGVLEHVPAKSHLIVEPRRGKHSA
jgi:hypothetical protein